MSITIETVGDALLRTRQKSIGIQAVEMIAAMQSLGWLPPDQIAARDAETTRRALEMAAKHIYDNFQDPIVYLAHDAILALQPAPTEWVMLPVEPTVKQFMAAEKAHEEMSGGGWVEIYRAIYRAMTGSVK